MCAEKKVKTRYKRTNSEKVIRKFCAHRNNTNGVVFATKEVERSEWRNDRVANSSVYNVNCQKVRFSQKVSPCSPSTFLALLRAPSRRRYLTRCSAHTFAVLFYLLYAILKVLFQHCYTLVIHFIKYIALTNIPGNLVGVPRLRWRCHSSCFCRCGLPRPTRKL